MSKTPVKRGRSADLRARQLELRKTLLEPPDVLKVLEKVVSPLLMTAIRIKQSRRSK